MNVTQHPTKRILPFLVNSLLFLVLAIFGVAVQAETNQPTADAVVGSGTPASCTEAALDTALNSVQSSGGGTITFNCGAALHTITLSVYRQISSPVTINGANLISLDGNNTTAFFQVLNGASLNLTEIELRRGLFTGIHPLENFGTLILDGVKLAQNVSGGSAIANYGTLTIQDSTLSDNGVTGGSLAGAALVNDGGTALVEGSTFSNNTIPGNLSVGGAIANQNGNLTITGSTFSGNSAFDGGALRIASGTNVTVTQSTFEGNIAGYGGAIESWGTRLIVHDVRFAGNRATVGDGGAIWTLGGDLDIERSEFASNQATTTGGAISCYGDFISVIESAFGGNQADGHGGAVYSTCTLNMTNNTLAGNQAKGASKGGGALYHAGSEAATLQHVTIADNTAAFGAGIYNDGGGSSTLNISRSIVAHNPGGNCDGVITSDGYNLSNDNGCGAFSSPGDLQNANLPLGPLADNGGPTWTRMPLAGNQAIDAIPLNQCTATIDQRGVARPAGNGCDSGAVEGQATDAEWKIYLPLVIR